MDGVILAGGAYLNEAMVTGACGMQHTMHSSSALLLLMPGAAAVFQLA